MPTILSLLSANMFILDENVILTKEFKPGLPNIECISNILCIKRVLDQLNCQKSVINM